MNFFRMTNSLEDLAALPVRSVVCNPFEPRLVALKTSLTHWSVSGRDEGVRSDALWALLSAAGEGRVQVLWDPSAPTPVYDPVVWRTTIPGRTPKVKIHKKLGHARSAVTRHLHQTRGDLMLIEELNPLTGKFFWLHEVYRGTRLSDLPWK